jgi:hypothetical protein
VTGKQASKRASEQQLWDTTTQVMVVMVIKYIYAVTLHQT